MDFTIDFDFLNKYEEALFFSTKNTNNKIIFLSNAGYFICPVRCIENPGTCFMNEFKSVSIENADIHYINDDSLKRYSLIGGKIDENSGRSMYDHGDTSLFLNFHKNIFLLFIAWTEKLLYSLHAYLQDREAFNKKLIHYSAVRFSLTETIVQIEMVKRYLNDVNHYLYFDRNNVVSQIEDSLSILSKLAGGRAFLQKNCLDILVLFHLFSDVYR